MNRTAAALVLLAILSVATQTQAAPIVIDFEKFNDYDNLHGVNLGGVTLSSPSGNVEVFDTRFGVSYHSATKAVASPDKCFSVNPLIGVFDEPVMSVSLWGGDAATCPEELDYWELLVFDAPSGGNLLGWAGSGTWNGNPYRQLTITARGIRRFEARWRGSCGGIGYDDLQFELIPEPAAAMLLGTGMVGLLAFAALGRYPKTGTGTLLQGACPGFRMGSKTPLPMTSAVLERTQGA